jgi:hypothetical protein
MKNSSHQANTGGVPNRGSLYAVAAAHSKDAIETLYDLMKNSRNEGIRLGAAKAILNKSLPDLKSSDVPDEVNSDTPELADIIKRLRKGYLTPDQVIHEMSPAFQEMMIRLTKNMSEGELVEKFTPSMVEWILEERNTD